MTLRFRLGVPAKPTWPVPCPSDREMGHNWVEGKSPVMSCADCGFEIQATIRRLPQ